MELFSNDGHLTDQGLQALMDEKLDEMGRLEAAEHLSFCDECLLRYTSLLEGPALLEPGRPMAGPVLKRLRKKGRRITFSRYGTVAAAACLAVLIWGVSSFALPQLGQRAEQRPASGERFGDKMDHFLQSTSDGLGNVFGWFTHGGALPTVNSEPDGGQAAAQTTPQTTPPASTSTNPLVEEAKRAEAERKKKEQVFDRRKQADAPAEADPKQDDNSNAA